MEFENNQPTDEEQRRLAEARKITLQPLHAGITPDPIPDAEISARRTREDSPNTSNDTEDTSALQLIQPSKSALNKPTDNQRTTQTNLRPLGAAILVLAIATTIGATTWLWIQAA